MGRLHFLWTMPPEPTRAQSLVGALAWVAVPLLAFVVGSLLTGGMG